MAADRSHQGNPRTEPGSCAWS